MNVILFLVFFTCLQLTLGQTSNCGGQINEGASVSSSNGKYHFTLTSDGDLQVYSTNDNIMINSLGTAGLCSTTASKYLTWQCDGNIVLFCNGASVWNAALANANTPQVFSISDRGNLLWHDSNGRLLWSLISTSSPCRDGWIYHEASDSCYGIGPTAANFSFAREQCVALGAEIASILDAETNTFIQNNLPNDAGFDGTQLYIGLEQEFGSNANPWYWLDNETSTYTNWQAGEPNGATQHNTMWDTGTWYDVDNTTVIKPLCKEKLYCDAGWTYDKNNNNCLYVSAATNTRANAESYCSSVSSELISLNNETETAFMDTLKGALDVWIGLVDDGVDWNWADGTTLNENDYNNWTLYSPGTNGSCAMSDVNGEWVDTACNGTFNYVCERTLGCLPGWTYSEVTKRCYTTSDYDLSFTGAIDECASLGGTVASAETEEAREALSQIFPDFPIWISLEGINGTYNWLSGYHFAYAAWDTNQPNNSIGEYTCVVQQTDFDNTWYTDDCFSGSQYFVCEHHIGNTVRTPSPTNVPTTAPTTARPTLSPVSLGLAKLPTTSPSVSPTVSPTPSNRDIKIAPGAVGGLVAIVVLAIALYFLAWYVNSNRAYGKAGVSFI